LFLHTLEQDINKDTIRPENHW